MGSGVLVPATYAWSETTLQILQTFGILLSVTKMVLFALIINGVGTVNSLPQVLALIGSCVLLFGDSGVARTSPAHRLPT